MAELALAAVAPQPPQPPERPPPQQPAQVQPPQVKPAQRQTQLAQQQGQPPPQQQQQQPRQQQAQRRAQREQRPQRQGRKLRPEELDVCHLLLRFLISLTQGGSASLSTLKQAWQGLHFSYIFEVRLLQLVGSATGGHPLSLNMWDSGTAAWSSVGESLS